jgi:hypothetical protein
VRARRGENLKGFVERSEVSSTIGQILFWTGFRRKRLAASRRGLFGKTLAEHLGLAWSKTRRRAVYDVDHCEDVLNLRQEGDDSSEWR